MINKKQLEIILSKLKTAESPKPGLEQYTISGELAAQILNLAYLNGDIKDKIVFDLGCGSGKLTIGSFLLGAKEIVGVDTDDKVLEAAEENFHSLHKVFSEMKLKGSMRFMLSDIKNFSEKCDTVIQNPPFGVQSENLDRVFLGKALECGKKIYSLHKGEYEKTRESMTKFIESKGGKVEKIIPYKFPIPHMFKFHSKPKKEISVDLYVIRKI
jgi:putative methylase